MDPILWKTQSIPKSIINPSSFVNGTKVWAKVWTKFQAEVPAKVRAEFQATVWTAAHAIVHCSLGHRHNAGFQVRLT